MDRYTKIVLTLIAAALLIQCAQNFARPAQAQLSACGTEGSPCFVATGTTSKTL